MKSIRLNFGSSILFMAFLLGTVFLPGYTKANEPVKLTDHTNKYISRGDSVLVEYPTRKPGRYGIITSCSGWNEYFEISAKEYPLSCRSC